MASEQGGDLPASPVLLAYDGSELAGRAIEEAGKRLAPGQDALVVCVWQPADVGFSPLKGRHLEAYQATEVHQAAEETAAYGAALADRVGFRPESVAVEAAPTWKGIMATAEQRAVSLIVLGSHRHPGLTGHLVGSVAAAVLAHATSPVLVVPYRS